MSGRTHVDVNERRLRPIYDCLDIGNNKKAIQEADRVLKKQKDLLCAKALRSLALIRLGRQDEVTGALHEVHALHPYDEQTLQAMAMCYRDICRLDLIADMYENAHKSKPDSEEILNALFMAYVRLGVYKRQQQVAMTLHKLRPQKNPYYFWAVMSIVMQAQEDEKLGKSMFLPLAEKMTLKYIEGGKLEAEAEVRLYLIILQSMGKYQEALDVLDSPLAVKLTSEPDFPKFLKGELLAKLQRWPLANAVYKQILCDEPEHWKCYKEYFNSAFHLVDSGWTPENSNTEAGSIDHSVHLMVEFIKSLCGATSASGPVRGPFLAQLELKRMLKERGDEQWRSVFGESAELFKDYLTKFNSRPCCYADLYQYTPLVDCADLFKLLQDQIDLLAIGSCSADDDFKSAKEAKVVQQHLTLLELQRYGGLHHQMSTQQRSELMADLLKHYEQGLSLGKELLTTDLQYVDNYALLLVHILYDAYTSADDNQILLQSILLLEKALRHSPSNFQFKLLLVHLYARLGAVSQCSVFYNALEIKHIQNDSLGYIISNHVMRLGHLTRAESLYDVMLKFFMSVHKDTSDFLISSYKYGSFPKVQEFVNFKERLQNSLQFATAMVEKLLLEIILTADNHKATQTFLSELAVDPLVEKTDFNALRDNRDCQVFLIWDSPERLSLESIRKQSFDEEKSWLRLRNLVARCLIAAGRLTPPESVHPGGSANSEKLKNGESSTIRSAAADVVYQLSMDLSGVIIQLYGEYGTQDLPQRCVLQGPFRTRLIPYLRLGLGKHLLELLGLLTNLDRLRDEATVDKSEAESMALSSMELLLSIQNYVSKNQLRITSQHGCGSDSIPAIGVDVEVLECFVLIAEHISYVTVVMGACQAYVKPLKSAIARRGKKRKESDPGSVRLCDYYSSVLEILVDLTTKLCDAFKMAVASDDNSLIRFEDLSLDGSTALPREKDVELSVTEKIQASYHQTSCEMMELLRRKQRYLESIRV